LPDNELPHAELRQSASRDFGQDFHSFFEQHCFPLNFFPAYGERNNDDVFEVCGQYVLKKKKTLSLSLFLFVVYPLLCFFLPVFEDFAYNSMS
jgi:hypothetical protein